MNKYGTLDISCNVSESPTVQKIFDSWYSLISRVDEELFLKEEKESVIQFLTNIGFKDIIVADNGKVDGTFKNYRFLGMFLKSSSLGFDKENIEYLDKDKNYFIVHPKCSTTFSIQYDMVDSIE